MRRRPVSRRPRLHVSEFAEICLGLTNELPVHQLKDTVAWLAEYFVREFIPVECPPMWAGGVDAITEWRIAPTTHGMWGTDVGETVEMTPASDSFDEYALTHALNGDDP